MAESDLNEKLHEIDRRLSVHEVSHNKDMQSLSKALDLQAVEYERRLTSLNGEAARLREMQAHYVPRELYEQYQGEVNKTIAELRSYRDTNLGRQAVIATIIPVIVSVVFWWLNRH